MEKVNNAWRWYLAIWVVFAIVGLGLRLLTTSSFLSGFGIALVFFAGVGLMIDGFADRRAQIYSIGIGELKVVN
jgi:membrane protein implicated in regulation of membrane protease activity